MTPEEIRQFCDEKRRREILDARQMSPEDKLLAGARLFDYACAITLAGIRSQNPGASEARVQEILRERLAWAKRKEQAHSACLD